MVIAVVHIRDDGLDYGENEEKCIRGIFKSVNQWDSVMDLLWKVSGGGGYVWGILERTSFVGKIGHLIFIYLRNIPNSQSEGVHCLLLSTLAL